MDALVGAGDESLGQWIDEVTAIHVRRRLSMQEQLEHGLSMIDIRGTPEAKRRADNVVRVLPRMRDIAETEIREMPCRR